MKFSQMPYKRPNMEQIGQQLQDLTQQLTTTTTAEEQLALMEKVNEVYVDFRTMHSIGYLRHAMDKKNEMYEEEHHFFLKAYPEMGEMMTQFDIQLLKSPHLSLIEKKWGTHYINGIQQNQKFYHPDNVALIAKLGELITEYWELERSLTYEMDGQEMSLSQLAVYWGNPDRAVRKAAYEEMYNKKHSIKTKVDDLVMQIRKIRHQMAKNLGLKDYTPIGYSLIKRTDITQTQIAAFREQVKKHFLPLAKRFQQQQQKRLGLDTLYSYDRNIQFKDGNAKLQGDADFVVAQAKKMYEELSEDTTAFFSFMQEHELLDLKVRKDKALGTYCSFIPKYKSPFIVAQFNGTHYDFSALTHEFGHAFQKYQSQAVASKNAHFYHASTDIAEIHSMSLELITAPWYSLFFGDDANKYLYTHIANAIKGILWDCFSDEFQHYYYGNPSASISDLDAYFKEVRDAYSTGVIDESWHPYAKNGEYWRNPLNIAFAPFYAISYGLANTCALQFWKKYTDNPTQTWQDYLAICKAGGSAAYEDIMKLGNLKAPYEEGCVAEIAEFIHQWLDELEEGGI